MGFLTITTSGILYSDSFTPIQIEKGYGDFAQRLTASLPLRDPAQG
jgi:hypothetical protein